MEKSIVTFNALDQNQTIEITFEFNNESRNLDYHIKTDPEINEGDPVPENFNFWLANFFLNALRGTDESAEINDNDKSETN